MSPLCGTCVALRRAVEWSCPDDLSSWACVLRACQGKKEAHSRDLPLKLSAVGVQEMLTVLGLELFVLSVNQRQAVVLFH